jgi:beta-glucosidase
MRRISTLFLLVLLAAGCLQAQSGLDDPTLTRRADRILQQMTLEEKIGQLVQYSAGVPTGPGTGRADYGEQIAKGQIGSLLNLTGAAETNALQRIAMERSRLKIPLLFGLDVIHGYRTIFPVPLGMASTWDPHLVQEAARVAAEEASAEGVRWVFSPMVDIARDARWGRIVEGAGEDPYLGSVMAAAYVRGYQGAKLADPDSVAACAKHYVGYGAAEGGRDYNAADMSERTLREIYLPPFRAAVGAGVASVMSAFNTLNGVPASADRMTLSDVLRLEWHFPGVVVSDWQAVKELIAHGIANDGATAAKKAILAGVDVDMESGLYQQTLAQSVRSGAVPEAALDQAVGRVLRLKLALGLFEHPYTQEAPAIQPTAEHRELARTIAERSLILLKNDAVAPPQNAGARPLLPLSSSLRTIALVGPLADSAADMLGSWPGKGDPRSAITLKAALEARLQPTGGRLLYAKGAEIGIANGSRCSTIAERSQAKARCGCPTFAEQSEAKVGHDAAQAGFAAALEAARQADVVIAALGENAEAMTGEAASRAHLDLPGNQQQLLEKLVATGKPVVLVVFSGRPLALCWAAGHVPAIVQAWYPGIEAGPALVRGLFGDVNFSGKLTVSVPRAVGQEPLYYDALSTGRPADGVNLSRPPSNAAEKYVSRYIDEENTPLFPFGYGLSYTRFSYSPVKLSAATVSASRLNEGTGATPAPPNTASFVGPGIRVSAVVTNTGTRPGLETVQLYIRQRGTSVARPVKELKGFKVLQLAPGESRQVEFTLGREQLAFWNLEMRYQVEPAQVSVWVAPTSADGAPAQFTITE